MWLKTNKINLPGNFIKRKKFLGENGSKPGRLVALHATTDPD